MILCMLSEDGEKTHDLQLLKGFFSFNFHQIWNTYKYNLLGMTTILRIHNILKVKQLNFRYDCHRDQWFDSSRMATSRSAAGVTVIDGCIYVAGGYDGYTG